MSEAFANSGRRSAGATTRTARDYLLVAVGKVAALASLLVGAIVVARVAGRAEFGLFNTALALALILDGALGSPIDATTIRFSALHEHEPIRVLRFQAATFRLKVGLGAALGVIGVVTAQPIAQALFGGSTRSGLPLAALALVMSLLLARGTSAYIQSQRRFRQYSLFDASLALSRLIALGVVGALGAARAETYLYAQAAGTIAVFGAGLATIRQPYLTAPWPARRDARAMLSFLGAMTAVIALGTITGRADVPILALFQAPAEVGAYSAGAQLAAAATMFAGYAAVIVQPRLIPAIRVGLLPRALAANVLAALAAGVAGAAVAIWLAPWLATTLFGASFESAAPVLRVLIVGTILDLLFMPVPMTYALQLRPRASALGETFITTVFLALAPFVAREGLLAMAWLATGVRGGKCLLYFSLTLTDLRHAPTRAQATMDQGAPQH